ncbi:MAG TPA: SAV_6107 family HEPN domain-containing protein [Streptosporangiales bacterium]
MSANAEQRARRARAGRRARVRRLGFSAGTYLAQARRTLAEAAGPDPGTPALRYSAAHLAALRGAAAVLAARGRPDRRRAGTAWTELAEVAPELEGWADVFSESARLRAAADAGTAFRLGHAEVDAFCRLVGEFLDTVDELVGQEQAMLPTAS